MGDLLARLLDARKGDPCTAVCMIEDTLLIANNEGTPKGYIFAEERMRLLQNLVQNPFIQQYKELEANALIHVKELSLNDKIINKIKVLRVDEQQVLRVAISTLNLEILNNPSQAVKDIAAEILQPLLDVRIIAGHIVNDTLNINLRKVLKGEKAVEFILNIPN